MTDTATDMQAAARLVAANPECYPIASMLDADTAVVIEPMERHQRYADVADRLISEAMVAAPHNIGLLRVLRAAVERLEAQRVATAQDKYRVCQVNQQLQDAVARLKCELAAWLAAHDRDGDCARVGGYVQQGDAR